MNRILFFIILIFSCFLLDAQDLNKRATDEKTGNEILLGNCTLDGLLNSDFLLSYQEYYPEYKPDSATIELLRGKLSTISCVVVLGTWCGDSKEQVPKLLKILDQLKGNSFEALYFICVDRSKTIVDSQPRPVGVIEKVPTFIFYRGQEEIGRIVETPNISLEKDLLEIVKKY